MKTPVSELKLLSIIPLIKGQFTLLVRTDEQDPLFQELDRATCNQLRTLLAPSPTEEHPLHFTVLRTAFGNLPVVAFSQVIPDGKGGTGDLLTKLRAKNLAFSEKNIGDQLPKLNESLKVLKKKHPEVNVWNAI
jgi:hypothetical protein